jgi:hypothetical protein
MTRAYRDGQHALWRTLRCSPLCNVASSRKATDCLCFGGLFYIQTSSTAMCVHAVSGFRAVCAGFWGFQSRFATLLTGVPAAGHVCTAAMLGYHCRRYLHMYLNAQLVTRASVLMKSLHLILRQTPRVRAKQGCGLKDVL